MSNALYGSAVAPPKYVFQEYPKQLNKPGEASIVVQNAEQEAVMVGRGYSTKPLAVAHHVGSPPPMTTQTATQSAYDALRRELAEKVDGFNARYQELEYAKADLQGRYDASLKENNNLRRQIQRRDERLASLGQSMENPIKAQIGKPAAAPETAEDTLGIEAEPEEELTPEEAAFFAQMQAEADAQN